MRGLGPALQATGIPVPATSPSIFQRMFGVGVDGTPYQAPGAPSGGVVGSALGLGGGAAPQATANGATGGGASANSPSGLMSYIGQAAAQRGIDPQVAQRVALAEGGASGGYGPNGTGDSGSSFSPFQLHYGGVAGGTNSGAGLGDDFTKATGLDARDPANAKAAIDFALDNAAAHGWGAFHGAARAGIGASQGIGGQSSAGQAPSSATAYAGPQGGSPPASSSIAGTAPQPPGTQQPMVGSSGQPPMPQATADRADPNGPGQSPQAPPTADQIRAMMADPATRAQGMQAWQAMQQQLPPVGPAPAQAAASPTPQPTSFGAPGAAPQPGVAAASGSALPGMPPGLTLAALGAMITEPATRAQGIALWQSALSPPAPVFGKPGDVAFVRGRPAYQIPASPMNVPQGDAVYDPSTRAPAFQNAPKLEHGPIGRDPNTGVEIYGAINTQTGTGTPFAQPGAGQPAANANLTGTDFLSTLPPQIGAQVKAIAEGRMALPTGQSANNPLAQRLRGMVLQYKPDFDVTDTAARAETRKDFASGNTAGVITAGNTALQHLGHLSDAGEMLTASQLPILNSAGQAIGTAGGANIAGKQYDGALNDFAGELTKFYRGTGGTEADINTAKAALAPNQSPAQRRASIAQQMSLVQSKVNALQARWRQGMGPNTPDYPLLQPEAMDAISRIAARGPDAPTAAPAAAPPIAAPVGASAAPAGAASQPMAGARQAPDGHFYTADPARPGKYLRVDP